MEVDRRAGNFGSPLWENRQPSGYGQPSGLAGGETEARSNGPPTPLLPRRWPQGLIYLSALSSQKPAPSPPPTARAILPQAYPQPPPSPPLPSHHLSLSHQLPGREAPACPPAACLLSAWLLPALGPRACERVRARVCTSTRGAAAPSLPPAGADPGPLRSLCARPRGPCPLCPRRTCGSCFFLYLPVFSPLSLPLQRSRQRLLE